MLLILSDSITFITRYYLGISYHLSPAVLGFKKRSHNEHILCLCNGTVISMQSTAYQISFTLKVWCRHGSIFFLPVDYDSKVWQRSVHGYVTLMILILLALVAVFSVSKYLRIRGEWTSHNYSCMNPLAGLGFSMLIPDSTQKLIWEKHEIFPVSPWCYVT